MNIEKYEIIKSLLIDMAFIGAKYINDDKQSIEEINNTAVEKTKLIISLFEHQDDPDEYRI